MKFGQPSSDSLYLYFYEPKKESRTDYHPCQGPSIPWITEQLSLYQLQQWRNGERAGWGQNLWALDQPVVSCQLTENDKNLWLSVFCEGTRRPQMPGWLEASLKLGLRRPQLSTDRSHGLLAANRLAEKASKFQSNYINPIIKINLTLAGTVVSQKA